MFTWRLIFSFLFSQPFLPSHFCLLFQRYCGWVGFRFGDSLAESWVQVRSEF